MNAVQETLEVGYVRRTRRYEINLQSDGGIPTHFVELTRVEYARQDSSIERSLELRYVLPEGRIFHSQLVHSRIDERYGVWAGT